MNNDGTLRYDTKVDPSGFKKGLAEIKKDAIKDSGEVLKSFNKAAKAIALSAASIGAGIVTVGVKYNSQMEQYNAGFTTMLGSAEKAQKLMGDLKGFAAKTPFELTGLANASTTLLAFGEDVEQLMPDLKMLGDISLGNAEKFKGLALVFGQVQSQGRLMGQDLLQMINQGFNPLQIISEKTGKSVATLKDEMAKGQITFEMVADAMKTATSEGGQFYNAMERQSKTLSGQWSTLKDNVTALTGEIASDISAKLAEDVLPKLINMVEELTKMWEDGRLQDYIGNAATAIVTFGTAIGALNIALFVNDMVNLVKGVKDYTTATKAGAAAQKLMNAELLHNPYVIAIAAVATLTAGIITYAATHKSTATEIVDSLEEMSEAYQDSIETIDKRARAEAAEAQTALVLKDKLFELEEQINSGKLSDESATEAKKEFGKVADDLNEIIPGIIDSIYDENGAISLQKGTVEELTQAYYDLVSAKAVANAYQDKINLAASNLIEAKEKKSAADIEFANQKADRAGDGSWFGKIWGEHEVEQAADAVDTAAEEVRKYEKEIEKFTTEMGTYEAEIKKLLESSGLSSSDEGNSNGTGGLADTVKKQTKEISKEFETKYKNLKRSLEREEITYADYYRGLEELRNTYFTKDSDEWEKYTQELADFTEDTFDDCLDKLDDLKKESLDKIKALKDEQDALTKKLMSDKSPVEFGTVDGEEFAILADYNQENYKLRKYKSMLDELGEARADLPETVYAELAEMDIDQAMKYVQALLNATDHQYNTFLENRALNEELAHQNSTKIMSAEAEEMKRILEEKFGELPEDFFNLGNDSASAFGDAFLIELESAMQTVKSTIMAEMSEISNAAVFSFASGVGAGVSSSIVNNNYSSSYTFNSSRETTTQQLAAAKDADTLNRLRGGI